jgi:AraC-like DNA-binding protein
VAGRGSRTPTVPSSNRTSKSGGLGTPECHSKSRHPEPTSGDSIAERIEFFRAPDLPKTVVLRVDDCPRQWRVYHETYAICILLYLPGVKEWTYRGKTHRSFDGELMLMEPGEVHTSKLLTTPLATFRVLIIDPAVVAQMAVAFGISGGRPHLKTATCADPLVFAAFRHLHAALEHPATPLERQSRFVAAQHLLLERCAERAPFFDARPEPAAVRRARAFIHDRFAEPFTLDALATEAGLSPSRLIHVFRDEIGIPPHAYQIQVRIAKARALLRAGIPPAIVATEVGFFDQAHLARHFKNILHVPPGYFHSR